MATKRVSTRKITGTVKELPIRNYLEGGLKPLIVEVVFEAPQEDGRDICIVKLGNKFQDLLKIGKGWQILTDIDDDITIHKNWKDNGFSVIPPHWFNRSVLANEDDWDDYCEAQEKMVNSPKPKTLRFLADILESATAPDGFGFIADSCLVAYCADEGVDYDEAKAYLDKNYPHKEIYDEETWILDPRTTWDQVKSITDDCQ